MKNALNILIIEDDTSKENYLKSQLQGHNLTVKTCLIDAFRTLKFQNYDAMFLDMSFPTFNRQDSDYEEDGGIQVLEMLSSKKVKTPVAIFSSSTKFKEEAEKYPNFKLYIVANLSYDLSPQINDFIKNIH